jgi:hypothetical protein
VTAPSFPSPFCFDDAFRFYGIKSRDLPRQPGCDALVGDEWSFRLSPTTSSKGDVSSLNHPSNISLSKHLITANNQQLKKNNQRIDD